MSPSPCTTAPRTRIRRSPERTTVASYSTSATDAPHPAYVLNHFHSLCREFGVPRTTVHDLRHLAATISITAGVPLTVVSKTLRHATLSTTANIYGHLTTQAARDAVDTIDHALTSAGPIELPGPRTPGDHITRVHNQMVVTRTQLRNAS
ncbi:tyrosine-type recombinase/integrase [Kitasatospora sp. NPDC101155]|uniref:tyrosine-type recombinase/integrase n=1 Tax=Kitasatospora sp. NPDC101155 TaxID=3364097 RepID=UPI003805E4B2